MQPSPELDVARNLRTIEWLKAELASSQAAVYSAMYKGDDEAVQESLANLVVASFLLGKRLGVGFPRLQAKIVNKVRANIEQGHEIEEWYGEFSSFLDHLEHASRKEKR